MQSTLIALHRHDLSSPTNFSLLITVTDRIKIHISLVDNWG